MERKPGLSKGIGDKDYIQKKVPASKKYGAVSSKLGGQMGKTAKDVNTVSDNLMAKRKGEKHKRIKCSTLAKLMTEHQYEESIYNLNDNNSQADQMSGYGGAEESKQESLAGLLAQGQNMQANSDAKSQMSGMSNMSQQTTVSAVTYATEALGITDQTSFLLLDLRDPDEYDLWRIKEALNYPAANIARDKVIPELYRFKNKSDKLIIIYMGDERKGCQAANLFVEKGYENVFLVSGGIEQFNEEFHHLVEGRQVPKPKCHSEAEQAAKKMEKSQQIKMRSQQKKMDKF